jgi:hypothetical protein
VKRTLIRIEDIADWRRLADAAWRAARGKHNREAVQAFFAAFTQSINRLSDAIRSSSAPYNDYRAFVIHDPKVRTIHAACFEDRVLHHALIDCIGGVMDRRLLDSSFACRVGKGVHASAKHVQHSLHRYPWFVKIDIDGYFANIEHGMLFRLLQRTFKGDAGLQLLWRMIEGYEVAPSRGLPIGSLTSQHFANYFLNDFDQSLLANGLARAHCRYMDDIIWWCDSRELARISLKQATAQLSVIGLTVKANPVINRSERGVAWCGYRITPGQLRLSRRRRRRYAQQRQLWELRWREGLITDDELQSCYAAVNSILCGVEHIGWRRENLRRHPSPDV